MFRLWGKIWKDNHLVQDAVAEEAGDDTRTHKVFHTLDEDQISSGLLYRGD